MHPSSSSLALLLLVAAPALLPAQTGNQAETQERRRQIADPAGWSCREVGDDVWLRQRTFAALYAGPQSLTLLDLRPRQDLVRLDVADHEGLRRTSLVAERAQALAAINGGFYDTKTGAPVGLLRIDGALRNPANARQGSLGLDEKGRVLLMPRPAGDWPDTIDALGAGPMLLRKGEILDHGERQRQTRHPRSAIGCTAEGRVLLLTVDGRTEQAAGMSFEELAEVLLALGCRDALNLDGGGSSTLWVTGAGVCNFPCDNKVYDHLGERAVANSVQVFAPAVAVIDDDAAELGGAGWEQRTDGTAMHGSDFAFAADGADHDAVFATRLPRAGRWQVLARWPGTRTRTPGRLQVELAGERREVRAGGDGAWQPLGEIDVDRQRQARIVLRGIPGQPFAVDAIRLRQRP